MLATIHLKDCGLRDVEQSFGFLEGKFGGRFAKEIVFGKSDLPLKTESRHDKVRLNQQFAKTKTEIWCLTTAVLLNYACR